MHRYTTTVGRINQLVERVAPIFRAALTTKEREQADHVAQQMGDVPVEAQHGSPEAVRFWSDPNQECFVSIGPADLDPGNPEVGPKPDIQYGMIVHNAPDEDEDGSSYLVSLPEPDRVSHFPTRTVFQWDPPVGSKEWKQGALAESLNLRKIVGEQRASDGHRIIRGPAELDPAEGVHQDGLPVFGHADHCRRWNLRDGCSCGIGDVERPLEVAEQLASEVRS